MARRRPWATVIVPVLLAALSAVIYRVDFDADSNFDWAEAPPWPVFKVVMAIANKLPVVETRVLPPHIRTVAVASAFIQSKALYAAAKLGVADALAPGPTSVSELAAAVGTQEEHLSRVLRLLTTIGIFKEPRPGVFANNRASGVLRRDHPSSVLDLVLLYGEESYWAFGKLVESLAPGHHGVPFKAASDGLSYWQWIDLPENKGVGERFDRAMEEIVDWNKQPVVKDYDWSQHANQTVADIGGGMGGMLVAVLEAQPSISGILFDRAPEIERAKALWAQKHASLSSRAKLVGGDFFESVPRADVYFLQHILHDWSDKECVQILKSMRRAIHEGSGTATLLLSEIVMAEEGSQSGIYKAALDLQMLAIPGGKERTVAQWSALLEQGGFQFDRVVPMRSLDSIIVALPASTTQ